MWVLPLSLWHVLSSFRIETLAVEIGKNFLFFLIYKYMTCFPNIPANINWNVLLCVRVVTVLINHRYFFRTLSLRLAPYIYNQVELFGSSRRLLHNWICTSSVWRHALTQLSPATNESSDLFSLFASANSGNLSISPSRCSNLSSEECKYFFWCTSVVLSRHALAKRERERVLVQGLSQPVSHYLGYLSFQEL